MNIEIFLKSLNEREIESLKKHLGLIEPKKPVIVKPIEERKREFIYKMLDLKNLYSSDIKTDFTNYWTEKNINGKKMRFEMQKTWDLKKRLDTWVKRSKQYNKGNEPKQSRLNAIDQL